MPFYIYAWIGASVSGLFVITAKLTSKHAIKNPWLFNFLLTAVTLLFTIPPAIYYQAVIPSNWTIVIIASIFSTLFNIFYIFSNYALDVSTFMPLFNFQVIFSVLIGTVFFNEKLSSTKLIFVAVILIAGMFSTLDEKLKIKSFFKKAIAIGLLTTLLLAISKAFTKVALVDNSLWTINLWVAIFNFLMLIPTISLFKKDLKVLDLNHVLPVGLMGIFWTIGGVAANAAYRANLSISSVIMNMPFSMIFAFMFSIFAPKLLEKHTLKIYAIRFSSTAIMIWAALQLSK